METLHVLAELRADLNLGQYVGITPVFTAAQSGNSHLVGVLMELKADVNRAAQGQASPAYVTLTQD